MAPTEEDVSTVVVIDDDLDVRNGLEHRLGISGAARGFVSVCSEIRGESASNSS